MIIKIFKPFLMLVAFALSLFLMMRDGFTEVHPACEVLTLADSGGTLTLYSDQRLEVVLDLPIPSSSIPPIKDDMRWNIASNSTPRVLATKTYVENTNPCGVSDYTDDSLWFYEYNDADGIGCLSRQHFFFLSECNFIKHPIARETTTTLTFRLNGTCVDDPPVREATFTIHLIQVDQ